MAETSVVASWLMILLVLIFAVGIGCVLSARARVVGLLILALVLLGMFSLRLQVSRSLGPGAHIVSLHEHGLPVPPARPARSA